MITGEEIEAKTDFKSLTKALQIGFQSDIETPMRHHHDFPNPNKSDSTLLLMPSWKSGESIGVKVVTVSPENYNENLPSIQGLYILMDAINGIPKALLEGKTLTAKRTAAASALASSYLSRKDSNSLLMLGTGALSKNLILAHLSQRDIKQVWVWGRDFKKAQAIANELDIEGVQIEAVENKDEYIARACIISCATLSDTALINGESLKEGQHIDLVGSYKKTSREANNKVLTRSKIFVDTFQGAMKETGDILIPLQEGVIQESDVLADLFDLTAGKHPGRQNNSEITVFKSVGHASEDLIAANYYYNGSNK